MITRKDQFASQPLFKEHQQKRLKSGLTMDVSKLRSLSNIEFDEKQAPFIIRKKNYFVKLVRNLGKLIDNVSVAFGQEERIEPINVYGLKGSGKTRFVLEAVRYLRYRYKYNKGMFFVDMREFEDFTSIRDFLDTLKGQQSQENATGGDSTSEHSK